MLRSGINFSLREESLSLVQLSHQQHILLFIPLDAAADFSLRLITINIFYDL